MIDSNEYSKWRKRVASFQKEFDEIAGWETSVGRVHELNDLLKEAEKLPGSTQEYFEEAIKCLEFGSRRAAIIFSWAGFIEIFTEVLIANFFDLLKTQYTKWKIQDAKGLREDVPEYHILEAAKKVGMLSKTDKKILQGKLAERNAYAHPTGKIPSANEAIGYVDYMIRQVINILR